MLKPQRGKKEKHIPWTWYCTSYSQTKTGVNCAEHPSESQFLKGRNLTWKWITLQILHWLVGSKGWVKSWDKSAKDILWTSIFLQGQNVRWGLSKWGIPMTWVWSKIASQATTFVSHQMHAQTSLGWILLTLCYFHKKHKFLTDGIFPPKQSIWEAEIIVVIIVPFFGKASKATIEFPPECKLKFLLVTILAVKCQGIWIDG